MKRIQETLREERVEQLKALQEVIADQIDQRPGARDLASLAKQFREIGKEIEDLEGMADSSIDIAGILKRRSDDNKPGFVRKKQSASGLMGQAYKAVQAMPMDEIGAEPE